MRRRLMSVAIAVAVIALLAPLISSGALKLNGWCKPNHYNYDPTVCTATAAPTMGMKSRPASITTTSSNCIGLHVEAGANLVSIASSNPPGTTYCLAAGTYHVAAPIPDETGDIWMGTLGANNARLSILTGNDSSQYVFTATADKVTLRNLVIERFSSPIQRSPFESNFYQGRPTGWLIDNIESRSNAATGVAIGSGGIVRHSYIHHNHQQGISLNGALGALVENNEIGFNNWRGENDPNSEAGGSKFINTTDLALRGNYVYGNCGPGLWTDSNNLGTIYENNRITNNAGQGIVHEISYAAIIRNNQVEGNGHGTLGPGGSVCRRGYSGGVGGIYVSTSRDVEVSGNNLVNNDGGVIAQQEDRGVGNLGVWESDNLAVHDNDVTFQPSDEDWMGFRYVSGPTPVNNIRFENNDYHLPNVTGRWFNFDGFKNWAQWRAFGFDDTGTLEYGT